MCFFAGRLCRWLPFLLDGSPGFSRNLTSGEIIAQLWFAEHALRTRLQTSERVISNVVMMGMGEPLQNYAALVPALRIMLDDHGYGLPVAGLRFLRPV